MVRNCIRKCPKIVKNCIRQCRNNGRLARQRKPGSINRIIIHRCSVAEDAPAIADIFKNDPDVAKYTGSKMPYTFVVLRDGTIQQAVEVLDITPHARKWNHAGLAIAVVGDFRKEAPTAEQWMSLVPFVAQWIEWGVKDISGHTELDRASSDPNKICPGAYFDLDELRRLASNLAALGPTERLGNINVVF